jgi:hypothetical protein
MTAPWDDVIGNMSSGILGGGPSASMTLISTVTLGSSLPI